MILNSACVTGEPSFNTILPMLSLRLLSLARAINLLWLSHLLMASIGSSLHTHGMDEEMPQLYTVALD